MAEPSAKYNIFSITDKESNVGIWWLTYQQQEQQPEQKLIGQPVRLAVDLVEWTATPVIIGGGPTRLGPGPYKYTTELEGDVFATNEIGADRRWWLIPANQQDTYLISKTEKPESVWTAKGLEEPIRVEPFEAGNNNQVFKIVPIFRANE